MMLKNSFFEIPKRTKKWFPYLPLFNELNYLKYLALPSIFFVCALYSDLKLQVQTEKIVIAVFFNLAFNIIPIIFVLPYLYAEQSRYSFFYFYDHTHRRFSRLFHEISNLWLLTFSFFLIEILFISRIHTVFDLIFILIALLFVAAYLLLYLSIPFLLISTQINPYYKMKMKNNKTLNQNLGRISAYAVIVPILLIGYIFIISLFGTVGRKLTQKNSWQESNLIDTSLNFGKITDPNYVDPFSELMTFILFATVFLCLFYLVISLQNSQTRMLKTNASLSAFFGVENKKKSIERSKRFDNSVDSVKFVLWKFKFSLAFELLVTISFVIFFGLYANDVFVYEGVVFFAIGFMSLNIINTRLLVFSAEEILTHHEKLKRTLPIFMNSFYIVCFSIQFLVLLYINKTLNFVILTLLFIFFVLDIFMNVRYVLWLSNQRLISNTSDPELQGKLVMLLSPLFPLIIAMTIQFPSLFSLTVLLFHIFMMSQMIKRLETKNYEKVDIQTKLENTPTLSDQVEEFLKIKNDFLIKSDNILLKWANKKAEQNNDRQIFFPIVPPYCDGMSLMNNLSTLYYFYNGSRFLSDFIILCQGSNFSSYLSKKPIYTSKEILFESYSFLIDTLNPESLYIQSLIVFEYILGTKKVIAILTNRSNTKLMTYYSL